MNARADKDLLDEVFLRLCDLLEERNFNKIETNLYLIGTLDEHKQMIKILEENPNISEDEFLKKVEEIQETI